MQGAGAPTLPVKSGPRRIAPLSAKTAQASRSEANGPASESSRQRQLQISRKLVSTNDQGIHAVFTEAVQSNPPEVGNAVGRQKLLSACAPLLHRAGKTVVCGYHMRQIHPYSTGLSAGKKSQLTPVKTTTPYGIRVVPDIFETGQGLQVNVVSPVSISRTWKRIDLTSSQLLALAPHRAAGNPDGRHCGAGRNGARRGKHASVRSPQPLESRNSLPHARREGQRPR